VVDHDLLFWAHRPGDHRHLAGGELDRDITRRAAVVEKGDSAPRGDRILLVPSQDGDVGGAFVPDGQVTGDLVRYQGRGQGHGDEPACDEPKSTAHYFSRPGLTNRLSLTVVAGLAPALVSAAGS